MVCGVTILIGMMRNVGGMTLFSDIMARFSTPYTATLVVGFTAAIVSVYASTSGVILPAFLPIIPDLVTKMGGGDPLSIVYSVVLAGHLVDVSPLSTTGALLIGAAGPLTDKPESTMEQAELIPLAQELGCCGVEFRPYWKNIKEELPEIRESLIKNNLICTYASNEGLLADSEVGTRRVLDSLRANVKLAETLGTNILRLNIASEPFNPAFIQTNWWQEAVRQVLVLAASMNITLAVENGPDPQKSNLHLLQQILTTVNSPNLQLTYDTGNWLYGSTQPDQALDILGNYIGYVHLKDMLSQQGTLKHSYLGTGLVDIKSLVRRIQQFGYSGYFTLEFPGGDNPKERILHSLKYLGS